MDLDLLRYFRFVLLLIDLFCLVGLRYAFLLVSGVNLCFGLWFAYYLLLVDLLWFVTLPVGFIRVYLGVAGLAFWDVLDDFGV